MHALMMHNCICMGAQQQLMPDGVGKFAEVPVAQKAPDGAGGGGRHLGAEAAHVRGGRRSSPEDGRTTRQPAVGGADHRVPAAGAPALLPAAARVGPPAPRRRR